MRQKILVVTDRNINTSPRLINEINVLKSDFDIYVLTRICPKDSNIQWINSADYELSVIEIFFDKLFYRLPFHRYAGSFFFRKTKYRKLLHRYGFSIVINHDPGKLLDLQRAIKRKAKLVFNAHEYFPLEFENDRKWMKKMGKYYQCVYRRTLSKVDLLINVSNEIAKKCKVEFNIDSLVVPNTQPYLNLAPKYIREGEVIRIVHFGGLQPTREIEKMIQVMDYLDKTKYELHIYSLDKDGEHSGYIEKLYSLATKYDNVWIKNDIEYSEVLTIINHHHIGIYILPPLTFNNKFALPNKIFQFIQARVALAIAPSPEMVEFVKKYQLGIIANDFTPESMAKRILSLRWDEINRYKENCDKNAFELSAENYYRKLYDAVTSLAKWTDMQIC